MKIVIPSLPPTDNHLYLLKSMGKGKRVIKFMSKEGKEWKEMANYCASQCYKGPIREDKVDVEVWFYLKRERDIQGSLKVLFDSLEGVVYKNDKQVWNFEVHKVLDEESKVNPRIEVFVK